MLCLTMFDLVPDVGHNEDNNTVSVFQYEERLAFHFVRLGNT